MTGFNSSVFCIKDFKFDPQFGAVTSDFVDLSSPVNGHHLEITICSIK